MPEKVIFVDCSLEDANVALQTPFGLLDGRVVEPNQVKSGLACGCICPGCGTQLVAKHGSTKRKWHFAHYRKNACLSCLESSIHAAAKQVLLEERSLYVPGKLVSVNGTDSRGSVHTHSAAFIQSRLVKFDYCYEELWESQIRPDIVGTRGEKRMYVEMYFTHKVDEIKLKKIEGLGVAALEIDLSDIPRDSGFDQIRQCVLSNISNKRWLFCPGEDEFKEKLQLDLTEVIEKKNKEIAFELEKLEMKKLAREKRLELNRQIEDVEHFEFRSLSLKDKEHHLMTTLGIEGKWPYYLNKEFKETNSINEFPRIWQASLFAQFIHKQRRGTNLTVNSIADWVIRRFGARDPSIAAIVVASCLRYLCSCGFITRYPQNGYDQVDYLVAHPYLNPPQAYTPKPPKLEPRKSEPVVETIIDKVRAPHVMWRAYWPKPDELKQYSEIPLKASLYQDDFKQLVEKLSTMDRRINPREIAEEYLAKKSIPIENTLQFLIDIKVTQRIIKEEWVERPPS